MRYKGGEAHNNISIRKLNLYNKTYINEACKNIQHMLTIKSRLRMILKWLD
jgi:hypothetical protein